MKFTHAHMEVLGMDGRPVREDEWVDLNAEGDHQIDIRTHGGSALVGDGQVAEIRRFLDDAERAEDEGQETGDTLVLLDWFVVHDVTLHVYDGRLTLTGYQQGAEGARRNGSSPVAPGRRGHPHDDRGRPLARVRWDLW